MYHVDSYAPKTKAVVAIGVSAILSSASVGVESDLPHYIIGGTYVEQKIEGSAMSFNVPAINNLNKIKRIACYKEGWDGYSAKPIDAAVIENAKRIINGGLIVQPELFPNSYSNTIQFEYEGLDGKYLELQITKGEFAEVFEIREDTSEHEYEIPQTVDDINRTIGAFYGL